MNCPDCTERLHDYVDGGLATADTRELEAHVAGCASCRAQLESLQALLEKTRVLPREIAPPQDLWRGISEHLTSGETPAVSRNRSTAIAEHGRTPMKRSESISRPSVLSWFAPLAIAASVIFLASFAERAIAPRASGPAWSVANVAGAPRVDARTVLNEAQFRVGQWLETDDASRAKVTVGAIGEVNVERNSRLRLVGMAATDHRLELARGELSAFIYAPPRLFFVNTPSATAVDLGCAYTLKVDDEGNGELEVTLGYVALEDGDRESIIRRGMKCFTRRGVGPGTPFAVDAPEPLLAALKRFDFERGAAAAALPDVLAHARAEDTITLWHLLARTRGTQCGEVFDLLAKHAAPPAGVTRAGIVSGDKTMRKAWGSHLGIDRF